MSDREQEQRAIQVMSDMIEWWSPGMLHRNFPKQYPTIEDAEDTLRRLESQGLANCVEGDGGPHWRLTTRGVREAAESAA